LQILQNQSAFHAVFKRWICKYSSPHRSQSPFEDVIMNCTSNTRSASTSPRSIETEALATLHDTAKERAQALRREAISAFIDDAIAWSKAFALPARRANSERTQNGSSKTSTQSVERKNVSQCVIPAQAGIHG
jgi:hypothetical protein